MIAPCKDCKKRAVGCHSICREYLEWQKKNEERRNLIVAKRRLEVDLIHRRNVAIRKFKHSKN